MSFFEELEDLFNEARDTFTAEDGTKLTLTFDGQTVPCIAAAPLKSQALDDANYTPDLSQVVELLRSDFQALEIDDRSEITINGATVYNAKVLAIEDDPADACVTLRLSASF